MLWTVLKYVQINKCVIEQVLSASSLITFDHRDLLSEFRSTLSDMKTKKPLVMLVDGVDLVKDSKGQLSSDWIPQQIPEVSYRHETQRSTDCVL